MSKRAVIIGSGAAAVECVDAMNAGGYAGEIHVFSDTAQPPYNPMLTTYYACGKISYDAMFPYGTERSFWKQRGVIFHENDPVTALDAGSRTVGSASGHKMGFDHCLIASGAAPFVPPVEGCDGKRVYTVRTVADAVRLRQAAEAAPKKVIVVGASMVGIKVVELFHQLGAQVCLADMAPYIFPLAAHPACAVEIEERLKAEGVKLRFKAGLSGIRETCGGVEALFGGEEPEAGDLVVLCIGVRPNLSFSDPSQIATDRGILVDERMETNVPGIYAAGDVAQGQNVLSGQKQIIGLWASARSQGRTAGRNIAGGKDTYRGSILHNITHFMGMDFVGLGDVSHCDTLETERSGQGLSMLFWKDGRLCGANFLNRFSEAGVLKNALIKGPLMQDRRQAKSVPALVQERLLQQLLNEVKR